MNNILRISFLLSALLVLSSCDLKIKPQNFEVEGVVQSERENLVNRTLYYNPEAKEESSRLREFSATEISKLSSQKLYFKLREGLPDPDTQYYLTSVIQDKDYIVAGGGLLTDLFLDISYGNDWVRNKMGRLSSLKLFYETLSDSLVEKQNETTTNVSIPVVNWLYRLNKNDPFVSENLKPNQILNTKMLDSLIFNQLKTRVLDINNTGALDNLPPLTTIRFPENPNSMQLHLIPHVELINGTNYIVGYGYIFKADIIITTGIVENRASVFIPIFILFNKEPHPIYNNRDRYRVVTVPAEGLRYPPDELKITNKILVTCQNNLLLGELISGIIHEKVKENVEGITPDQLMISGFQLDDALTGLINTYNDDGRVPKNFNVMAKPINTNDNNSTLIYNNEGQMNSYEINILSK